ncbi:MAG: hypothetical protein RMY64_32540 [Nostoc sp. DedQUE08]|uniref:hypothetical protein n=1 Tax=Nostoc sp. DedQUE08 TaxID=3075393 RepID=UPI002AD1D643|nr:hypothetical protein [Nostoc sp. DedQUE08]MDZ8070285.1 hypothetical protein [Nostoc sp. DedQUE08]
MMNRFTSILLAGLIASASALAISPKAEANTPASYLAEFDSYGYEHNNDANYERHSRHYRNGDYDRHNDLRNIRDDRRYDRDNNRRYDRENNRRYERENNRRYERENNRRYERENHRRYERENNRRYDRENNRRYDRDNDLRNIDNNRRYERDRGWERRIIVPTY